MKFDHKSDWFYKYPTDEFTIEYNFTKDLATGDSLATPCTASIYDTNDTDMTNSMIDTVAISSSNITFNVKDGIAGETYSIRIVGRTSESKQFTHYMTCEIFGDITLNTNLGDPNANSYVTIKEANDYIRNKYGHKSVWDTLSVEGKKRLLIEATEILNNYNYVNSKYYDSQKLAFPTSNHTVLTGNCASPLTINSFKNTGFMSDTYGEYPSNYWKYGTVHIVEATPLYDVRNINTSHVTTGVVTMISDFSATPTINTTFKTFVPLHTEVKNAQIEQTLFIVENFDMDTLQNYRNLGAKEVSIGDVSISFGSGNESKITVSPIAKKFLSRWLRKSLRVGRA